MKALVGTTYGSPDVLRLEEVEDPVPEPGHVLVRIRAASVNAGDYRLLRGEPYLARPLMGGLRGPNPPVRGWDGAGVVEAIGDGVDDLAVGDEVFGSGSATFAELASLRAEKVAPKPPHLTFEEAAALPVAGVTALQALQRSGVGEGRRVLVNGAGGGVGTFTVQIAKSMGAHVTAVCSARNVDLATNLGADRVIDYGSEDFTRNGARYDVVVDNVGTRPLRALRRTLTKRGTLVIVGGGKGRVGGALFRFAGAVVLTRLGGPRLMPFITRSSRTDLLALADLVAAGKLRPVIERTYPLAEAAEAIRYVETGHARGKVIVVPEGAR